MFRHKTGHELDVVGSGLADEDSSPLLALGEAEWNETDSGASARC